MQSPIFLKSFETTVWLLNLTKKFPKHQRFVLAKRIEDAALSFQDHIVFATKTRRAQAALHQADFHLERLRLYNRLAFHLRLIGPGQHEYLAKQLDEMGRLLGGWLRRLHQNDPSDKNKASKPA